MKDIAKDIPTIRKELFEHIEAVQADYIAQGFLPRRINLNNGVIRGLLEIFIYGIYQLYQFLAFIMTQASPKTATADWKDLHAGGVDLTRKVQTKASGFVTFTRSASNSNNIKIEQGKIVRTLPDAEGKQYRYIVSADTMLAQGIDSVLVPVASEDYGVSANATAGMICELVTPIDGIASVDNTADWLTSEASDNETDEQLYERYQLQWRSLAGVTSAAYKLVALSVPGVAAVDIHDQHPRGQGTIDIIIQGAGGVPTDALIEAVNVAVAKEIIINDDVLVFKAEGVAVSLACTIEYTYGKEEAIHEQAFAQISARFAQLSIGTDVILAKLISDAINIAGVKRISFTGSDVEISRYQIAQLESLAITMQAVDNE